MKKEELLPEMVINCGLFNVKTKFSPLKKVCHKRWLKIFDKLSVIW